MRWLWIDRFTEFVSGSHARGFKNVTLAEEVIDDYSPSFPMLPATLIIESLAQLGGVLILEHFDFEKRAVLAKVSKAKYHSRRGRGIAWTTMCVWMRRRTTARRWSALATATENCWRTWTSCLPSWKKGRSSTARCTIPATWGAMLRLMNFFHVAVDADGNPLRHYENL